MKIVELFKSIDGEGIRTGKIVTFIRSFGCILCCNYCDSIYANEVGHGAEPKDMTVEEIVEYCKSNKTPYVTFTGGEPLIQKDSAELIEALLEEGFEVNVETCGAVDIQPFKKRLLTSLSSYSHERLIFTIDYKSISSGENNKMIPENFTKNLNDWDVVKFVVGTKEDLEDMKRWITTIKNSYSDMPHIFVSPIFGMIEPKQIVEYIIQNDLFDVRMQLQIHKYIWDFNARGV